MADPIEDFLADPDHGHSLISKCFTQILSPNTAQTSIANFLVYLHNSGLDRDPLVITQAVNVLKGAALKWPIAESTRSMKAQGETLDALADAQKICVDIVGTGGDGHNTFNVSTAAAIVAAGVPRIRVIKHGNKASTSASGSADILTSYGCNLDLNPSDIPALSSSFLFLLAPIWNPALKNVAAIRKQLRHPTIFNILGPLLNPAPIEARIIGVHSPELGPVFIESFSKLNPHGRCMIVCGDERLDEISPAGSTTIWTYDETNGIQTGSIKPEEFGLARHSLESVKSGSPEENAALLTELLSGRRKVGDPVLDYIVINCAALLRVSGVVKDYQEGVELALDSIKSGAAERALATFRVESQRVLQR